MTANKIFETTYAITLYICTRSQLLECLRVTLALHGSCTTILSAFALIYLYSVPVMFINLAPYRILIWVYFLPTRDFACRFLASTKSLVRCPSSWLPLYRSSLTSPLFPYLRHCTHKTCHMRHDYWHLCPDLVGFEVANHCQSCHIKQSRNNWPVLYLSMFSIGCVSTERLYCSANLYNLKVCRC